jgi:tRNA pseudouridine55 synthase
MRRPKGDPVDGVLLLDKPVGMTSNTAVGRARWLLGARKAGHTGTLDPLASGLLPITFGEATKFAADLLDADKAYEARVRFGVTTTTGDGEGEVTSRTEPGFGRAELEAVLRRFTGSIEQVPPMHSALKRDGRPLYELARAGLQVERQSRRVRIERLDLLAFDGGEALVEVECSKGTYVRVLAEDLGAAMGCGAHLAGLRRTRVGPLALGEALAPEQLEALSPSARRAALRPVDALLAGLPRIELGADDAARFAHGQRLPLRLAPEARVRVYARDAQLLGTASVTGDGVLAPQRLVHAAEQTLKEPA